MNNDNFPLEKKTHKEEDKERKEIKEKLPLLITTSDEEDYETIQK